MPALSMTTAPADLARLYPWFETAAADLPRTLRHAMHVALEEAVMNVAMHAFPGGVTGDVAIRLCVNETTAVLVIEDAGRPLDAPAPSADVGGLGLILMKHYCLDVAYERAAAGNRLTLRFPL